MSNQTNPNSDLQQPMNYEIRIKGHLDPQWASWFGDLAVTLEDNGDTLLTGPIVDQAALHGLLRTIRDLGMPLLAVSRIDPDQFTGTDHKQLLEE